MSEEKKENKPNPRPKMFGLFDAVACRINRQKTHKRTAVSTLCYPHRYKIVRPTLSSPPILLEVFGKEGQLTCKFTTKEMLTSQLVRWLGQVPKEAYHWENQVARRAVQHWIDVTDPIDRIPKAIGFKSDPELVFFRLPFDPIQTDILELDVKAPTWYELFDRITNNQAMMARIASIFVDGADRKQAVYCSGPKDSGKSQLMALLAYLSGAEELEGGAYATLSNDDLESQFWRASLMGKRVVCIGEATPKFINTEAFKGITGDAWHNINEKGKAMYRAKLETLLFFFSNDAPEIEGKPDLIERIIDCRIRPPAISEDEMLPDLEYQQKLKEELPWFLGCCLSLYQPGRIKVDRSTLYEAIDAKESWAIEIFEAHFRPQASSWLEPKIVTSILRSEGLNNYEIGKLYKIWGRRYGIEKTRVMDGQRRPWAIMGMTKRGGF